MEKIISKFKSRFSSPRVGDSGIWTEMYIVLFDLLLLCAIYLLKNLRKAEELYC